MQKSILLIGAGRSSIYVIDYLAENALKYGWKFSVADMSEELLNEKTAKYPCVTAIVLNIDDKETLNKLIESHALVISLLPPSLHIEVAKLCLHYKKHLLTASYLTDEIRKMGAEAKEKGLIFLNEMGLDPGIDHMSAMKIIHKIQEENGELTGFKSFCGGLIAPESDNNPWNYKFTWNPRNVVLAGQGGTAKYIEDSIYKYIPYHQLFKRTEEIDLQDFGKFEAYANRDSLSYREVYGLKGIKTMLRGTIRKKGFCQAWDVLLQLGLTDDSFRLENSENMSFKEFVQAFLNNPASNNLLDSLAKQANQLENSEIMSKIAWLDILSDEKINLPKATPAQVLQKKLEEKWALEGCDKDMVVMQHQFSYIEDNDSKKLYSDLVLIGESSTHTAMAKTVGLPLAIAAKLILEETISLKGVNIPVSKEIYNPILNELKKFEITFIEYHP